MKNNWFPTVHIFCSFIEKRRSTTTIDIIERWQSSTTWIQNEKSECDERQLISDCPRILFVQRKTTIDVIERWQSSTTWIQIEKSECNGNQLISDCPHILFVYRKTTINDHDRHHRTMTIINNMDPKRKEWVWWKTTDFRLSTYFVRSSKNDDQRPRSTSSNDDNHQQHGCKTKEWVWWKTTDFRLSTYFVRSSKNDDQRPRSTSSNDDNHQQHGSKTKEWVWWKTTDFRLSTYFVRSSKNDDQRPRSTSSNDDNHQQHGSKSRRVSVMENNWFPTVHVFCSFIEKRPSTTTIDIIERWQSSTTWIPNDKSECDGKQLISDCPRILFVHRKTTINDHDRHHRTMTIINNMDPNREEWV